MAQKAYTTNAAERTNDLSDVEEGDDLLVHFQASPSTAPDEVEATVTRRHAEQKIMVETTDGRVLIVTRRHGEDKVREFDTEEVVGRFMFVSPEVEEDEDEDEETELVYENRLHVADETGENYTRVSEVHIRGEVKDERGDATVFEGHGTDDPAGGDGKGELVLKPNGTVLAAREDGTDSYYEVGENGRIE